MSNPPPQLYAIQPVLGRGKGLVASCDISKGTRIIAEKPLFTAQSMSPMSLMESTLAEKVEALKRKPRRQFLFLHNNFPGEHKLSGIFRTNALSCGVDSPIGGIYATICRINHSCAPNAHHCWNSEEEIETIHATCDIQTGEEITISYCKPNPRHARRAYLKNGFGFDCDCSLCSLSPSEIRTSDARLVEIERLDDSIGDPDTVLRKPEEALANCRIMRQLLEVEHKNNSTILLARMYYDAFQISITHGDQARASVFAQRAYEARRICEGEDCPESRRMREFMEAPSKHRNFGASKRWRNSKSQVPRGLDAVKFDEWLWRE